MNLNLLHMCRIDKVYIDFPTYYKNLPDCPLFLITGMQMRGPGNVSHEFSNQLLKSGNSFFSPVILQLT